MYLKGKLIGLRSLRIDDAACTLEWRLSERAQYLNRGAKTIAEQKKWILQSEKGGDLNFIIEYNGKSVGMISLYAINKEHKSLILGRLLIGEEKIVGSTPVVFEAEMLALDYAFEELKVHSVYGDVMSSNIGVLKMRRFLHWHKDGVIKEHFFVNGKYEDAVLYSILHDAYYQSCRPVLKQMVDSFCSKIIFEK